MRPLPLAYTVLGLLAVVACAESGERALLDINHHGHASLVEKHHHAANHFQGDHGPNMMMPNHRGVDHQGFNVHQGPAGGAPHNNWQRPNPAAGHGPMPEHNHPAGPGPQGPVGHGPMPQGLTPVNHQAPQGQAFPAVTPTHQGPAHQGPPTGHNGQQQLPQHAGQFPIGANRGLLQAFEPQIAPDGEPLPSDAPVVTTAAANEPNEGAVEDYPQPYAAEVQGFEDMPSNHRKLQNANNGWALKKHLGQLKGSFLHKTGLSNYFGQHGSGLGHAHFNGYSNIPGHNMGHNMPMGHNIAMGHNTPGHNMLPGHNVQGHNIPQGHNVQGHNIPQGHNMGLNMPMGHNSHNGFGGRQLLDDDDHWGRGGYGGYNRWGGGYGNYGGWGGYNRGGWGGERRHDDDDDEHEHREGRYWGGRKLLNGGKKYAHYKGGVTGGHGMEHHHKRQHHRIAAHLKFKAHKLASLLVGSKKHN